MSEEEDLIKMDSNSEESVSFNNMGFLEDENNNDIKKCAVDKSVNTNILKEDKREKIPIITVLKTIDKKNINGSYIYAAFVIDVLDDFYPYLIPFLKTNLYLRVTSENNYDLVENILYEVLKTIDDNCKEITDEEKIKIAEILNYIDEERNKDEEYRSSYVYKIMKFLGKKEPIRYSDILRSIIFPDGQRCNILTAERYVDSFIKKCLNEFPREHTSL